ncbi:endonuclease domain-containing protein [Streptomyces sp. T-3]|nr:endonuclease domain-containing protein [Streptomyces sp. T-3]
MTTLRGRRDRATCEAMADQGEAQCFECGETKSLSEFSMIAKTGIPLRRCKPCNAEKVRLSHYSVTREFLERLLGFQDGQCAICGIPEGEANGKSMHVGHDHACCPGRRACGACVRGLVCSNCSVQGLAWYETLPDRLRKFDVINQYLGDPPAKRFRAWSRAVEEGPSGQPPG